jgi:hypothetical protein
MGALLDIYTSFFTVDLAAYVCNLLQPQFAKAQPSLAGRNSEVGSYINDQPSSVNIPKTCTNFAWEL